MGTIRDIECESGSNAIRSVVCIQGGGGTSLNCNGNGWNYDICFTLNATDVHGVAYEIYTTGKPSGGFEVKDHSR